jgi:2,5-diketo-D-gluconate reductase A
VSWQNDEVTTDQSGFASTLSLPAGGRIPVVGLGVWQIPDGAPVERAVTAALAAGYRHVDTATLYRNEGGVGAAIRGSGVPREDVFVTTKYWPGREPPASALHASLRRLRMDYVDLYLIHRPTGDATRYWAALEDLHAGGLARTIGVSNYSAGQLEALRAAATVAPAVHQFVLNPFSGTLPLLSATLRLGIVAEAYSPLSRGRGLQHPVVEQVAARAGCTPAQAMLSWALAKQAVVLPKSARPERIRDNAHAVDVVLDAASMTALDGLARG